MIILVWLALVLGSGLLLFFLFWTWTLSSISRLICVKSFERTDLGGRVVIKAFFPKALCCDISWQALLSIGFFSNAHLWSGWSGAIVLKMGDGNTVIARYSMKESWPPPVIFQVDLLVLDCLFICLPGLQVLLNAFEGLIHLRQDRWNNLPGGDHDKRCKSWLLLGNICSYAITEERNFFSVVLFDVTLVEEFFKQKVRPIVKRFKFPCEGHEITWMHQEL